MDRQIISPPSQQAAVEDTGGCLTGMHVPLLAVGFMSILMIFILGEISILPPMPASVLAAPGLVNPAEISVENQTLAGGGLSPVFTEEVQHWSGSIQSWAGEYNLDPNLVATVMQIESCGDPKAVSRSGAMSLFQVMPYHFFEADEPYDPDTNAARGLAYLQKSMTKAGGDTRLALAGYNGGIGVIGRSEVAWAAETQRYAYWGSGIYEEASQGATESARLMEWLEAGGASLCRQAHQRLGLP